MIGRLRGELIELDGSAIVVECAGVGYEVLVPESVLIQMPAPGERVFLYVRQVFREDGVTLYGFVEAFQRRLFDLLLSVKGCGPKIGLALIGQLGEEAVAGAILSQDPRSLSRAQGVGPRLAERIILELKDKMAEESLMRKMGDTLSKRAPARAAPEDDLVDALVALGFRRPEAEAAAKDVREQSDELPVQVRLAVARLSPAKATGARS
jgi:Holliday junction DNA helicase RuvA